MNPFRRIISNRHGSLHVNGRPLGLVLIVVYKLIWGVLEVFTGLLIYFSYSLINEEITEDPQDLFLNWLLDRMHIAQHDISRIGILVVALGLAKLALAAGLYWRPRITRQIAMVFFSIIAVYGIWHLSLRYTDLKLAAEVADVGILLYFWKVLPQHAGDKGMA